MVTRSLSDNLRETLALFGDSGAPRTTTEVADRLDLGRRATYERLDRLVDHGELETKKAGSSGRVWWRPRPRPTDRVSDASDWPAVAESLIGVLDDAEVGMFVLDADFEVVWVNDATERYFGLSDERVLGQDKRTLIEEQIAPVVEAEASFAKTVSATYDDNTYAERFECRVTAGEEREARWLEHRSRPITSGAYAGGRIELYYDITEQKQSERAHRYDQTRFESLVEAVEEYAICMLDTDGRVRSWNTGAEQIKGYAPDDVLGEHVSMFYTEDDREAGVPETNLAVAAETGSAQDEGWRVRSDGSRFRSNVTITAIRGADGELEGYAKVTQDMTEQRERERQLRRERNLTEQLLEIAPVRLAVFRTDGSIERMNSQARRQLGIDESAVAEFSIEDLNLSDVDGNPIAVEDHPVSAVLETREPVFDRMVQQERPDGRRRWVSLTATPLFDEDEQLDRIVVAGNDVTELKQKERQLERQRDELESELEDVFERVDDAFYAIDGEFRFTYVNDRAEELLGRTEAELLGCTVWEALSVADDDPIRDRFETAMATQTAASFERFSEPLGIWETVRVYPSESGLSIYFADITERKARERELEQYETIVETVDDGVYAVDPDARFVTVNEAFCEMTGYDRDELLGSHATTVHADEITPRAERLVTEAVEGERDVAKIDLDIQTSSGETIPAESRLAPFPIGDEYGRCGVVRDISDRVERERALEESERRYRTLAENFPNGAVGLYDDELTYTVAGGEYLETIGVSSDEIVGTTVSERYPDDLVAAIEPYFRAVFDGKSNSFEVAYRDRQLLAYTLPVRGADDEIAAGMLVIQDITERTEYQRRLEESNERLEQFAYAVSHDLQEPLRMVTSYLQLLENRYGDALDGDGEEFIDYAVNGAERMRRMIDGLLEYSRIETRGDPFESVDLMRLVEEVCADLQFRIEETDAEITAEGLPRVEGDASQIRQVLQNLLSNAITYSGDERPRIDVTAERDGPKWIVSVRDKGIGIDPDDTDRIFEVFERLHSREEHDGTGIGLALCRRIVERHDGEIRVESEPGEGSTFSFTLPASRDR
ncbi:PAS domain S-box protein [Halopiger aswanensis]|uniref:histidine kinase n=1 Tax=Halopiger aswanensis TaxID=148449 RepID=A0A3R7HGC0_9EURY|nr:PAS domain S-box protein [Halopiger aswanensis]RKD89025.1 PAS domain S-box-containing protein [Halopiger aswanensis]